MDFPHSTRAKKYFLVLLVGQVPGAEAFCRCQLVLMPTWGGTSRRQCPYSPLVPSHVQVGGHAALPASRGMDGEDPSDEEEAYGAVQIGQRRTKRRKGGKAGKGVEWIVKKKAQQRGRGHENIKPDTKYTGRKRKVRF